MARPAASPAARIKLLQSALPKAQALRSKVLTREPMAELLGVNWKILKRWCDEVPGFEESGAFERGAQGIGYEFKPAPTVRFLIKHFESVRGRQVEQARRLRKAIAGSALDDLPDDMSPREIIEGVRAASVVREEQQAQGFLLRADTAAAVIEQTFNRMLQAGMQAGREQDPTGQWPPEYAEMWRSAIDNLILAQGRAGEEALKALRGGNLQSGTA